MMPRKFHVNGEVTIDISKIMEIIYPTFKFEHLEPIQLKITPFLQNEIDLLKSISPYNYLLNLHNRIANSIFQRMFSKSYLTKELLVADCKNEQLSGGGWVDHDNQDHCYVVYDVDFIRGLYLLEQENVEIILSSWSLVGHEWGHIEQVFQNIVYKTEKEEEDYANDKMAEHMLDFGFTEDQIKIGYNLYYKVFRKIKLKDFVQKIHERDGKGTKTDLDASWGIES